MSRSPTSSNGVAASPSSQGSAPTGIMHCVTSTNGPDPGDFVRSPRFPSTCANSVCSTVLVSLAFLWAYVGWAINDPARAAPELYIDGLNGEVAPGTSGSTCAAAVRSTLVSSAGALRYIILEWYGLGLSTIGLVCALSPAIEMCVI